MTNFHEQQSDLTAAKIEFYKCYIEKYLPKVLMGFEKCFIADLFCGTGKNGLEKGSPLVLLERAQYILSSETLKIKSTQIDILFNDNEACNVENLKQELQELKGTIDKSINIRSPENKDFVDIFSEILKEFKNNTLPKLFFLDPFTYSNVRIDHLRSLMNLNRSEVLLFVPIFHIYRFAKDEKMKEDHKTRIFVETFTKKGIADYENIEEFMQSIKEKLKEEVGLDYVRPVLLDGGKCKNALFLLTKSQKGMLCMNKVALKKSEDGKGVVIKWENQPFLFEPQVTPTPKLENFSKKLTDEIKNKGEITNHHAIKFGIMEEFLPKHVKDVLIELYNKNEIKVFDSSGHEIKSKHKWYIAEIPKSITIFRYNK